MGQSKRDKHYQGDSSAAGPLGRWERAGLWLLVALAIGFGVLVEIRSSFLKRHMTDLGVYLRVAWAVRTGRDIYDVTDDNDWHYQYPPLFGILMAPLADAPAGVARTGMLPFAASAAIWYLFSIGCLIGAVHTLAAALEQTSSDAKVRTEPRRCRRWWALRLLPILACMPPIGHTLMRGQVNLLLLALLCAMVAAWLRGQSLRAGLWLSGAICLKVIPAFLLLYPLWRRDWRSLAGCAFGLVLGCGVIPAAVFGMPRTVEYYREYKTVLLDPALRKGSDQSRAKELIEMTASDSQSFLAALHNTIHLDRSTRPTQPSPVLLRAHWLIGGVLTLITLLAAGWRRRHAQAEVLLIGNLIVMMILLSPVCHLHYFCLCVPLVMALLAASWKRARSLAPAQWLGLLLASNVIADSLPHFQGFEVLRDVGLATYGALALWLAGCIVLWKHAGADASVEVPRSTATGYAA